MKIDQKLIKKMRGLTGAGIVDIKKALEESRGSEEKAVEILRKKGEKVAIKKESREVKQGRVAVYVHSNDKVAALVALACETDFVANNQEFKDLAYDLAMQVAAMNPSYLGPEEVPAAVLKKEKEIIAGQLRATGKPEKIWEKIMAGKLEKFYEEVCLLKQPFIKDDKKKIEGLIKEKVAKLGENIKVKNFIRFSL